MSTVQPYDKLHSYAAKHLAQIYSHLIHGNNSAAYSYVDQGLSVDDLCRKIKGHTSNRADINNAHYRVIDIYKAGSEKGIHRKGRPLGSTNKPKQSNSSDFDELDDIVNNIVSNTSSTLDNKSTPYIEELFAPSNSSTTQWGNNARQKTENNISNTASGSNSSTSASLDSRYVLNNQYNSDRNKFLDWKNEVDGKFNTIASNEDAMNENMVLIASELAKTNEIVKNITDNRPTVLHLTTPALPELQNVGTTHSQFPTLLKMCNARLRDNSRLNIWVHGPAGTGKTFSAMMIAKLLFQDKPNAFQYNGALTTSYQVLGYQDANGHYVTTAFRDAWEHGGVYLFDEIDASMPDALLALNGALANSVCRFPDKLVHRHPDCIILAGANTTGQGATLEYAGRMKQDAALTDRFVFLHWPQDKALEDSIIANKTWLDAVRKYRDNLARHGIKNHNITSRASIYGEALIAAGLTTDETEQAVIKKGLTEAQFNLLKQ